MNKAQLRLIMNRTFYSKIKNTYSFTKDCKEFEKKHGKVIFTPDYVEHRPKWLYGDKNE